MTENELEFAKLLTAYNNALVDHQLLVLNKPKEPQYEPNDKGFISVGTIEDYKRASALYKQAEQDIQSAASKITDTKQAFEDYFPAEVKAAFDRQVAMFAPVPGGFTGILKEGLTYKFFTKNTEEGAREELLQYLRMKRTAGQ
jgi:hypothetical protein